MISPLKTLNWITFINLLALSAFKDYQDLIKKKKDPGPGSMKLHRENNGKYKCALPAKQEKSGISRCKTLELFF
jgi:hypothetical protein